MQSVKENIQLLWRGYKEVYELEPKMLIISIIQGIAEAIFPYVSLFFTSWILNILILNPTFEELIPVIAATLIITFVSSLLSNGLEHYRIAILYQTVDKKEMKMNDKVIYMDYEFIEDSKVHELRNYLAITELTGGQGLYYLIAQTKNLVNQLTSVLIAFGFIIPLFLAEIPSESSST